jgi:predicted XRE-type DNA-binding protein
LQYIYIYIYISELIYTHKEGRRLKPIAFLGDALDLLRAFPEGARKEAGVQLHKVQQGLPPGAPSDIDHAKCAGLVMNSDFGHSRSDRPHWLPVATTQFTSCTRSKRKTRRQTFGDVWDALADTETEAASMRMRSNVLIAIDERVRAWNVTQTEAARRLGVTQPRLNDLLRGRIQNFSLDALIDLAAKAGLSVRLGIAA